MKATDELYLKYAGVITAVVNHYSRDFPDLEDELYLQAGLIFCQACEAFKPEHPSGASFDTFLRHKLHSLTWLIDKALHGPSLLESRGKAPVRMMADCDQDEDATVGDPSCAAYQGHTKGVRPYMLADYSKQLETSGEYPQELLPYLEALQGDALQVFKDFTEGYFKIKPDPSRSREFNRAKEYLTPMKIYRRRYLKLGWSLERTRRAFNGIQGMLKLYMQGRLPCNLIPST